MPLLLATASVEVRPRLPSLLVDKLKARSNQTGLSLAHLIRHYTVLGMRCEEALPSILPTLGNISLDTPTTSRKQCQRYYIDSDLIDLIKSTPEAMISASKFVNDTLRVELVKRRLKQGGDKNAV
jgi:hypothetical protein